MLLIAVLLLVVGLKLQLLNVIPTKKVFYCNKFNIISEIYLNIKNYSCILGNKMPIGTVIGIDLLNIFPIEGVTFLNQSDFTTSETQNKIINLLNGEKVDVVLSDMAPNASGIKSLDHEKLIEMAYNVLK